MTSRLLRLAAPAVLAFLVAACGGTAATTPPTIAPTAAPTEAATEAATEGASPDLGALADLAGRLAELDSYTVSLNVEGSAGKTSIVNTTVRKPVQASKYQVSTADGQAIVAVTIGDEAWVSQDGTTFLKVPSTTVESMVSSLRPELLLAAFRVDQMADDLIAAGTETKNGQQATHYHIDDQTPVPPGGSTVPPGMTADFWITDDGLLVAFEASGLGDASSGQFETLDVQITQINDPSLTIERPE